MRGWDGTGQCPDRNERRLNRALPRLGCAFGCAGRRSQRCSLLWRCRAGGQSGEAGRLVEIKPRDCWGRTGIIILVWCSRQPHARMASPDRYAQKECVGINIGTGPGNCYEHERKDGDVERVRTRSRAGTRPGEGAECEESQPPSAKAYKVGEEGEQASMHTHTHTRIHKQTLCVRGWMLSQRGRGVLEGAGGREEE